MRKTLSLFMITFLAMLMVVAFAAAAAAFTIRWDPNEPSPDGYAVHGRWTGKSYDYSKPIWEGTATTVIIDNVLPPLPDIPAPESVTAVWVRTTSSIMVGWDQPADPVSEDTLYMIVRAFLNPVGEAPRLESADSEEANIVLLNTNTLSKWMVFYSEVKGGPYEILDEVVQTGGVDPTITKPITSVPVGEVKTLYFTVVAFGKDGTFSPNAAETSVLVDRRQVEAPRGISVSVTIPVQ